MLAKRRYCRSSNLMSEFFGVGAPATQGFDRDVELLFDEEEVVIVLVEQVEGFDFCVEEVVVWHGWESFR